MFIKNLAFEASAGSGKTFNLVVRYLTLLFMGTPPSKILTLTFTNKAANEMNERIIKTLIELESSQELLIICKNINLSKDKVLIKKEQILNIFLNSDVKIMTIDKFFTMIIKKFSLYVGLLPNFTTFATSHEEKLLNRFLQEVDNNHQYDELIKISFLMDKRLTDIFSMLHQLYIKKIEIQNLKFHKNIFNDGYLDDCFNALQEIRTAILSCDKASSTVKNAVEANSLQELLKKKWLERDTLNYSTFKKCYQPFMDDNLQIIKNKLRLHLRAKEQYFLSSLYSLLNTFIQSKKALAREIQEVSFDDISIFVYDLLHKRIDSEFLYFRLDSKIEHILLDEFQDTSVLQYEILRPLIKEITSGQGSHENGSFFLVGDVKQSIYRFRGGVSDLFEYVCKDNLVTKQNLLINYRSLKNIVDFVNNTFVNKIKNYHNQQAKDSASGGYVEIVSCEDILENIYLSIKKLLQKNADINEIAILCATNGDGQNIEEFLKSKDIEVITQTTLKLMKQTTIMAIIEYLKYQYFKEDIYRYNFFALLNRPLQKIDFIDFQNISLLNIVQNVVSTYNLFDNEFHLLRFINRLTNYQDIEEFLFQHERDDTTTAVSQLNGIRILTIHKSKGLEFEHVLVVDRLKKPPVSKDAIIYEYDGINLQNIYLRMSGRNLFDKSYANALQKDKDLTLIDSFNTLYVAFTRAKSNLFIIKKEKHSIFELLDLQDAKHGALHVKKITDKKKIIAHPFQYKALRYGVQTDILSKNRDEENDLGAIYFGLSLHYCLEMIPKFELKYLDEALIVMQNKYGNLLNYQEQQEIKTRIKRLLSSQEFLSLTNGICYKEKEMLVNGELKIMDLLVKKDDDSFNVIDYKSSDVILSSHVKQMREYILAVKMITDKDVKGYLCYLQPQAIIIEQISLEYP